MNILLVDDEPEVITAMMQAISFESLGFDHVFTAYDARRARECFERNPVDILLTDIEMPGESGLDLLAWVRDSRRETITLFCTAYADFNYAKKAIELKSFDYFLKPIAYPELHGRLCAAIAEVERVRTAQNRERCGALWMTNAEEAAFAYWQRVLSGAILSDAERVRLAADCGLAYTADTVFTLAITLLTDENDVTEQWRRYAFKNMAAEVFGHTGVRLETVSLLPNDARCLVLRTEPGYTDADFTADAARLLSLSALHLSTSANFFYRSGVTLSSAFSDYEAAKRVFLDDVTSAQRVIDTRGYTFKKLPYSLPHLHDWELMLTAGRCDELVAQLCQHLDRLQAAESVNASCLKAMRIDMMQMIHTILKQRQIEAHDIYADARFDKLRENSLLSVQHMKRYLEYIVRRGAEYIAQAEQSQSVVGRVKEYIHAHLSEEITRTGMAQLVFLNSDYLARIFKKETGQSLGAYLQDCRIHEAKRQLTQTNAQVNEIAQNVGYDNFSYFSHIFREKNGMTPNEYRRKNTGKGSA